MCVCVCVRTHPNLYFYTFYASTAFYFLHESILSIDDCFSFFNISFTFSYNSIDQSE